VLYTFIFNSNETQIKDYKQRLLGYDEQLSPAKTSKAIFVEPLYATKSRVFPSAKNFGFMGLIAGIALGGIYVLLRKFFPFLSLRGR
jgi:uncharacterized protein involved in exopolysaccharide biosynthesis